MANATVQMRRPWVQCLGWWCSGSRLAFTPSARSCRNPSLPSDICCGMMSSATGANFQLAYRSNFLPPNRRAAWIRFVERLNETADFAEDIAGPANVEQVLGGVSGKLRSLGDAMTRHIGDE